MAIQGCKCKELVNVGQVVDMFVKQTSSDDYFYAVVFDGQTVKEVEYTSTAFAGPCVVCGQSGEATIDANEETMAAYRAYCAKKEAEEFANDLHYGRAIPVTGERYIVVRGRKVAKGTTGVVTGVRQTMYGHMANLSGTWVDVKNLAPAVA